MNEGDLRRYMGMTVTDVYPETGTQPPTHPEGRPMKEQGFGQLLERHRRELHVHCYRMLGSYTDAEDLVQETFLRAWRSRDHRQPGSNLRAWLYRIATNACTDVIRSRGARPPRRDPRRKWPGCSRIPAAAADRRQPAARRRELPAPPGDTRFRAFKLDVLRVRGDQVAETTTFGSSLFGAFGLPEVLPETGS